MFLYRICINSSLPEIKKFAGPILQAVVVTLTRESPLEARAFSPDRWNEDGTWKHWYVLNNDNNFKNYSFDTLYTGEIGDNLQRLK